MLLAMIPYSPFSSLHIQDLFSLAITRSCSVALQYFHTYRPQSTACPVKVLTIYKSLSAQPAISTNMLRSLLHFATLASLSALLATTHALPQEGGAVNNAAANNVPPTNVMLSTVTNTAVAPTQTPTCYTVDLLPALKVDACRNLISTRISALLNVYGKGSWSESQSYRWDLGDSVPGGNPGDCVLVLAAIAPTQNVNEFQPTYFLQMARQVIDACGSQAGGTKVLDLWPNMYVQLTTEAAPVTGENGG